MQKSKKLEKSRWLEKIDKKTGPEKKANKTFPSVRKQPGGGGLPYESDGDARRLA